MSKITWMGSTAAALLAAGCAVPGPALIQLPMSGLMLLSTDEDEEAADPCVDDCADEDEDADASSDPKPAD